MWGRLGSHALRRAHSVGGAATHFSRRACGAPRRWLSATGSGGSTDDRHAPASSLEQLLADVASGQLSAAAALPAIRTLRATEGFEKVGHFAHIDHDRSARTGLPEVIFAEGKTAAHVVSIFESLLARKAAEAAKQSSSPGSPPPAASVVLATRVTAMQFEEMQQIAPDLPVDYHVTARACVSRCWKDQQHHHQRRQQQQAEDKGHGKGQARGKVCVVCAGTADLPVAEEAALTAAAFGAHVDRVYDVGVAGIHRLLGNLDRMALADVVICVAGMDGALPSVVGGLMEAPVIAVPTSVGYGASFNGVAPLLTMLNSCASGVCVMNIDNGFGAATVAAKILRKMGHPTTHALTAEHFPSSSSSPSSKPSSSSFSSSSNSSGSEPRAYSTTTASSGRREAYNPVAPDLTDYAHGPAALQFGTNYCGHCAAADPVINAAFREAGTDATSVPRFLVEDGPGRQPGRQFRVKLWPTVVFLRDGAEVARVVRPAATAQVAEALAAVLLPAVAPTPAATMPREQGDR